MRHQGLPIDRRRWASLYWSLLVFVRENPPPVFLENYSAEKRWSGFSPYLHVQLNFSVNRPILWQWTGILRSWFSTLIAEKVCLTTEELNAFENVRAIFFWDGVILVVGRASKYAWGADWLCFFQEVRVNKGPHAAVDKSLKHSLIF